MGSSRRAHVCLDPVQQPLEAELEVVDDEAHVVVLGLGRDVEATREYFQARRRLEESIEGAELRRPETKET